MNLDHLFRLRLAVARVGEMDRAGWWNTKGVLGSHGRTLLERGFPKTHHFAQARIVFAVARQRCEDVFSASNSVTLWSLPADIENEFETTWQDWLDDREAWGPFFEQIAATDHETLPNLLSDLSLASKSQMDAISKLQRSASDSAVQVNLENGLNDDAITMLAAAFAHGERASLTVPYAYVDARS